VQKLIFTIIDTRWIYEILKNQSISIPLSSIYFIFPSYPHPWVYQKINTRTTLV
jgi:hypothetical protein